MMWYIIGASAVAYTGVGYCFYKGFRKMIGEFLEHLEADLDEEPLVSKKTLLLISHLASILWPMTIFGFACGWGVRSFLEKTITKNTMMINNMIERTDEGFPEGEEEWRTFFSNNIGRIPRKRLILLSAVGMNDCYLSKEEIEKIISSELADRDLFGDKK